MTGNLLMGSDLLALVYRGGHHELRMEILDDAGDPFDLTGLDLTLTLWDSVHAANPLFQISGSIVSAPDGLCSFVFTAALTADLMERGYDAVVTTEYPSAGQIQVLRRGRVGVLAGLVHVEEEPT